MKVYVVITNGEEVKGEIEGVFSTYEKAKTRFDEIVAGWRGWVEGCDFKEDDTEEDFYCVTNFDEGAYCETKIEEVEVE